VALSRRLELKGKEYIFPEYFFHYAYLMDSNSEVRRGIRMEELDVDTEILGIKVWRSLNTMPSVRGFSGWEDYSTLELYKNGIYGDLEVLDQYEEVMFDNLVFLYRRGE
jgi:hypothetical protein